MEQTVKSVYILCFQMISIPFGIYFVQVGKDVYEEIDNEINMLQF